MRPRKRSPPQKSKETVINLPLTSYSIREGHIPRWWYIVAEMNSLLEDNYEPKDPCKFQWEKQGGHLIPSKNLHSLPRHLISLCGCKGGGINVKCNNRCSCYIKKMKCTSYCGCRQICSNNHIESPPMKRKKVVESSQSKKICTGEELNKKL